MLPPYEARLPTDVMRGVPCCSVARGAKIALGLASSDKSFDIKPINESNEILLIRFTADVFSLHCTSGLAHESRACLYLVKTLYSESALGHTGEQKHRQREVQAAKTRVPRSDFFAGIPSLGMRGGLVLWPPLGVPVGA